MRTEQNPYLVETKNGQILKFSRIDADNEAVSKQLDGDDVEVFHDGLFTCSGDVYAPTEFNITIKKYGTANILRPINWNFFDTLNKKLGWNQ